MHVIHASSAYNTGMDADECPDIEDRSASATPATQPRIWPVFVVPIIALAAAIVGQVAITVVVVIRELSSGAKPGELTERLPEWLAAPGLFILIAAVGQLAFGAAALLPARLSRTPLKQRLGLVAVQQSWTIYPLTMLGSLAPLAVGMALADLLARILPPDTSFQATFDKMTPIWGAIFVLFIALAPGFCEEMLFRGYIQRRLLQRWRPWVAITVASVIFGLMHVMPHAILVALPLGFWFGVIAWRTGSILPCIACHAYVNGGVNLWRMAVKFGEIPETVQTIGAVGALVVGLGCFVLACRQLARTTA